MGRIPVKKIDLKAKMLCEGISVDQETAEAFKKQNPSGTKRGGLSSGGKISLFDDVFVNAPLYRNRKVDLSARIVRPDDRALAIFYKGEFLCDARIIASPIWYSRVVNGFEITQIFTTHGTQLASSVYEACALFSSGEQCKFCVMNESVSEEYGEIQLKSADLIMDALSVIPVQAYRGITLNGGMLPTEGRGMELFEVPVRRIRQKYPNLPIAIEVAPPKDLIWIERLADAGVSSLMMNLECWDEGIRNQLLPGKNKLCPKETYFRAFEKGIECLGRGKVSTCFVVGAEPLESLKEGISQVVEMGVVPSPLAGRYFEDIPDYPFVPNVNWEDFLNIVNFADEEMKKERLCSRDKAGCVACGMCDLIKDKMPQSTSSGTWSH